MTRAESVPVATTELPGLNLLSRGKVRDVYDLGRELLLVATDRLSAFDHVLPNSIPDKGKVLNQISAFWFARTQGTVPNHVLATDVNDFPPALRPHASILSGRSMLVKKLTMFPVECVARGYLAGSGWKEYQATQSVCGIPLPPGLKESSKLPQPIFTPATKEETGHDENISFQRVVQIVGREHAEALRDTTLSIYQEASAYAATRGILIADTKLEFGLDENGTLTLADEVLTPDSSRFWPAEGYTPGRVQPSYDKQFVRDWLESIGWNKQPPVPTLPREVVEGTRKRYLEIFTILTGRALG
ncbi:MAG TPA: phosphoribosylaminoimidazolesuccinocarboxamide synthase [Candidatus Polarisedimenticolaceae bacterium]|nr:phosphoribosylaminoimidazolesuccinocarboxamide synthase [Candidatus Polarisedimenticolaceae bacterium]